MGEDGVGWYVVAEPFYKAEAAAFMDLEKAHNDGSIRSANLMGA
jgi:hypothetical protein